MVQRVGEVEVDVRANLDPLDKGLQQARRKTQEFNEAASKDMAGVTTSTQRLNREMSNFNKQASLTGVAMRGLNDAFTAVTQSTIGQLGLLPRLAGAAGIGAVVIAAQQAVQAYGQWELQQISFEARLRSTQGQLGLTASEITSLAQTISRATLTPTESLRSFALELGRTGEVTTDTLQRALRILPDLTLRVGDFGKASQMLSEALKNPANAVTLLRDAGIRFTDSQREVIEGTETFTDRLINAGDVLRVMEAQIGGEANAAGSGVAGSFSALAAAVSSFTVNLGGAIDRTLGFSSAARSLADAIERANRNFFSSSMDDLIKNRREALEKAQQALLDAQALIGRTLTPGVARGDPGFFEGRRYQGALEAGSAAHTQVETAQADLELAELTRGMIQGDAAAAALNQSYAGLARNLDEAVKGIEDQTEALDHDSRAMVQAIETATRLGLAQDPRAVERLRKAYQDLADARRDLAQEGRQSVFERENQRLEDQIKLLQYGNQEMRIRAELNRIVQAAERARQPLSDEEKDEIEDNIRRLERIRSLTGVVSSAFESLFQNMSNALVEFAVSGKFNFKQFADSVIRDMVRIATQAFIIRPLMQAITGMTNPLISNALGGGPDSLSAPDAVPGAAQGGSFNVPGTGSGDRPALLVGLTPGERVDVTPAGRASRMGMGGSGVTVINNINSSREFESSQTEREGPDGQRIIEQTFTEVMRKIGRGEGDNTFGARFGMRPRTVQR